MKRIDVAAVVVANAGMAAATFAPLTTLLPRKLEDQLPPGAAQLSVLAVIAGTGAVAATAVNLGAGWLSDRVLPRWQSRQPWVAAGLLLGFAGLLGLRSHNGFVPLWIAWILTQVGVNIALAALMAYLPDHVRREHRATVSGLIGIGQVAGIVGGTGLTALLGKSLDTTITVLSWTYLVLVAPAAVRRMRVNSRLSAACADSTESKTSGYHDFLYAWLTRFLISFSNAIALLYLYYYLTQVLHLADAATRQAVLVAVAALGVVAATLAGGRWSDRVAARKPLVILSLAFLTIAQTLLALFATWPATLTAAVFLGLGYGAFLAVDQALIVDVLPKTERRARDLGTMNLANAGPQVVAPLLAPAIISSGLGYSGLYAVAAALTVCGVAFVVPIRSIR